MMSYPFVYVARYSKSKKESGSVKANQFFFFLLYCLIAHGLTEYLYHSLIQGLTVLLLSS